MISQTKQKGFTIVELLIVIVIIAILAAISIVAYNGIQQRSRDSAAASAASQLSTKVEAWNSMKSKYPTDAEIGTKLIASGSDRVTEAELSDDLAAKIGTGTMNLTNDKPLHYRACVPSGGTDATGAVITYKEGANGQKAITRGVGC